VGRAAVAEEVEVELDGLEVQTPLARLGGQDVGAVLPLRSGRDLDPFPEKVEALREVRRLEGKLANEEFRSKAPPEVVEREAGKLATARSRRE